ncbi:MAG: response regulator [Chloroflexi bacterium]|nr:response regulator [Chloroflexota bacterium]
MLRRRVRVVLGSDGAQARDFLSGLVARQTGVVVGEAENALEALTLTRSLRPDIVILDCHLPHTVGLKDLPLSRAGGLDAAQVISREIPNLRVLLVGNLDTLPPLEAVSSPEMQVALFKNDTALTLSELTPADDSLIFTRVLVKSPGARRRFAALAEEVSLFGTFGVLLGLIMMVTGLLLVPGFVLAALGGAAALAGFVARLIMRRLPGGRP